MFRSDLLKYVSLYPQAEKKLITVCAIDEVKETLFLPGTFAVVNIEEQGMHTPLLNQ